tara:strand:+ start:318 stop:650 length:333 start_codon:yes stop_codon:yes gene_type:complete
MMLLTKENLRFLDGNMKRPEAERRPMVKFFTPWGRATWLISEYNKDTGEMFGLCDLGLGYPELGYVTLQDLKQIRGPLGLRVERDRNWSSGGRTLMSFAEQAREEGEITE